MRYIDGLPAVPIHAGASGAEVYLLGEDCVCKRARRDALRDAALWRSFVRECQFYERARLPFLPEAWGIVRDGEHTELRLRRYRPVEDMPDVAAVAELLAALHAAPPAPYADFLPVEESAPLHAEEIEAALRGWEAVLAEHGSMFDRQPLYAMAARANDCLCELRALPRVLSHGDFHRLNLLRDAAGRLRLCDWQNVCLAPACGDIAFFFSRAAGDGLALDEDRFLARYCAARGGVNAGEIRRAMRLSDALVCFRYWHMYLSGSSAERVRAVYARMA